MPLKFTPVIPPGSTILVTGSNGFIGSHISNEFLRLGYLVRGTARNATKSAWLVDHFDRKYGPGKFTLFSVPNMLSPDAYTEAIKDVSAVVHVATVFNLDPDPEKVISDSIAMTIVAMQAASREASVKRFILTSSSFAACTPKPDIPDITVTTETWNNEAVEAAYATSPDDPLKGLVVYAGSKVLQEKEAWKFMQENKPGFVLNAVLPNINFGAPLDFGNQGHPSTSGIAEALFKGDKCFLGGVQPQYFIDVQDTALLHVAAALHPSVESERIFGFAEKMNANQVLAILRRLHPDREFPDDFDDFDDRRDLSEIEPRARAEELLREMGQDGGWISLEESVRRNTEEISA